MNAPRHDNKIYQAVLALLESADPPSRNRNFEAFDGEKGRLVHHLYRLYLSLAAEVRRPESRARLVVDNGQTWLELTLPHLGYRRKSLLPPALAGFFYKAMAADS